MFNYNIHPIMVHFPIALLFIYSVLEVLPMKRWFPNGAWKHIKRAFLFFGTLGAFAALSTGEIAESFTNANQMLVETHAAFATFSTWVYGLLLAGEIAEIIYSEYGTKIQSQIVLKFLALIEKVFCHQTFSKILAIIGFFAITITGLLGGVMVYGVTADPLAKFVLTVLGIQL